MDCAGAASGPMCRNLRRRRRARSRRAASPNVQSVEIAGPTYTPAQGRLVLQSLDHCLFEEQREIFVDGLTGETQDLRRYLAFERVSPDSSGAFTQDVALVPAEVS